MYILSSTWKLEYALVSVPMEVFAEPVIAS